MVRGGSKLVAWCRVLGRQQRDSISKGGGGQSHTAARFSTVADVTEAGSKASDNDGPFGSPLLRDETVPGEEARDFQKSPFPGPASDNFLFGADGADSSPPKEGLLGNKVSPARGPFFPASQFPETPQPRLRNDRYFRSRNNSTVANMLKLLEAAASLDEVEGILQGQIPDATVSARWPWLPLLDALQRGPKPYLALEVFNWKKDKFDGGDPREYAKMISTAGKLNQLHIATTLFNQMEEKGVQRSPITCNALISAYSKNDQSAKALALFQEMQEGDDCKPTLVTYNTLISMYSKLNVSEMERIFELCKASGFYPDKVTFNAMIWGYMRGKDFDKMEEMYEKLKNSGCRPDPITFSGLIIGYAKANQIEKMELAFSHMQEEGFPISTMIAEILTEFYALDKKFEKMERIMKVASNTPGASCSSRIFGFAIQAYAESGRIQDMEETMEKMFATKRFFTSTKTLESVITVYGSRFNFEALDALLQRIKSMGWNFQHSTYHTLFYEYGKGREFEKMEEYFKEMEAATDVAPTEETYKILADSYRAAGDGEGLKRTTDRMSAAGFQTKEVLDVEPERIWTDAEIFGGRPR
ncbi:unnamed protein product [Calypogeia fissa]